eukprot:CAMPEP_0177476636 /NCGR_PEP_ID=MMETSP0369-20130122/23691_1 /TAXON_ID=447022 ORGANISM="Scrippsiella hangoei-like, Strain SHHI-4" /NCGR_SAMPLE_ID=MMETSP0369 /ASSEMBLY_ACC=CAM_ASM_000364 /LENGTH=216 /DNA_ID=CAMNT_0018951877 /DNA_START=99 /DNA_END=749 /DNA_ORIENTATION=-
MSPTLNPQDTFYDRLFRDVVLVFRNAEFQKGDIVVLRDPTANTSIVKRLISAKGGDFVPTGDGGFTYVPPGHCWVEGDNPALSVDSRTFNAVPRGLLDALVVAVVWPFWRARWLDIADLEDTSLRPVLPTCTGDDVDVEDFGLARRVEMARAVPVEAFLANGEAFEDEDEDEERTESTEQRPPSGGLDGVLDEVVVRSPPCESEPSRLVVREPESE